MANDAYPCSVHLICVGEIVLSAKQVRDSDGGKPRQRTHGLRRERSQIRWFLGTKRVNAFRQRIFGPQCFKTRLGNQSAIKRSF
jgi:hypothetical protein